MADSLEYDQTFFSSRKSLCLVICAVALVVIVMLMLVESEALELKSVGLKFVVSSKLLCTVSGEIMSSLVFRVGYCPYRLVWRYLLVCWATLLHNAA
jgi:hypothetical protein